ncbi:hypothetical protein Q7P37_005586 [Cladosporium fusiforme]
MARTLCTEDLVFRKDGNPADVATVDRTNTDVDTHEPQPAAREVEPIRKSDLVSPSDFKKFKIDGVPPKGTVFVRWVYRDQAELITESELELLHRSLFIGDIVTRRAEDVMSGVVLNVHTKCSLASMGTAAVKSNNATLLSLLPFGNTDDDLVRVDNRPPILQDIPVSELKYEESPSEDDLVTYRGWIGRVLTMTTALTVRLTDNCVVEVPDEVCELLSDHPDVPRVGDVVKTKKGNLRTGVWKFGQYSPNTPPIGSVVSTRATSIQVAWLQPRLVGKPALSEPARILERDELESEDFRVYNRNRKPVNASQEMTVSNSEIETSISLRVRFRDLSEAEAKYDGTTPHGKVNRIPRQDTLGYDMNVFEITNVSADVTVQWQDLTVTHERAVNLIPDAAIDDAHAAWPGEIAHSLAMTPRPDAATLYSPGKVGVIQCVKPDERMAAVRWCPAARIAYSKPEPDASDPPTVARELVENVVTVADGPTEELSLYDVECPAELNVRRGDIVLLTSPEAYSKITSNPSDGCWFGEVVDTWFDGRLLIRFSAADEVTDVALRREEVFVAIRSDGTDGLEGLAGEAEGMEEDSELSGSDENDEWESEDEEMEVTYVDENGEEMDVDDVENDDWESDEEEEEVKDDSPNSTDAQAEPETAQTPDGAIPEQQSDASGAPEAYAILETPVPEDHHYASQPSTSSPTHMKRAQKEHKILQSPGAIPEGVYIRTWESRLDLFRALFVGPEDTPYASAPFIMDFYLPTDYPHAPPQAYFHSWSGESGLGGAGRVNPNLYEDGKICLSLLGTWEGNKVEGWNAAKSTLLQVIVSLLGLVLVREPYFNEAGYEPLAGLESSKRPSALYNERTFLRSSGFLISAVDAVKKETQLAGLEALRDEVRWLYVHSEGPKLLRTALDRVEGILQRSDQEEKVEPDGATVMSKGACIPLRRVFDRLGNLADE